MSHGDFRHAWGRRRASDPSRNVPRETRVGGGVLRGSDPSTALPRGRVGGKLADQSRAARANGAGRDAQYDLNRRIRGTNGTMPVSAVEPRPPAILVWHQCTMFEPPVDASAAGPVPIYGQYPARFLNHALPLLGCNPEDVLHVCSGALTREAVRGGFRVDVRPEAQPDLLCDGRKLPADWTGRWGGVLIDPPYTREYAKNLYGTGYPLPAHLLREASRVTRPGGRIGFVHFMIPYTPPACRFLEVHPFSTGCGYAVRALTLFERDREQPALDLGGAR